MPITGKPKQELSQGRDVGMHALMGEDYHGLKPRMAVKEGDRVKKGSVLFVDKKDEQAVYASPVSGKVVAVNRGHRRALVSVVVESDGKDTQESFSGGKAGIRGGAGAGSSRAGGGTGHSGAGSGGGKAGSGSAKAGSGGGKAGSGSRTRPTTSSSPNQISKLKPEAIAAKLRASGLWTALRTRPFSKVPLSSVRPDAIFVNAMAPDAHAADPALFLEHHLEDFITGVRLLAVLAKKRVFVCCGTAGENADASAASAESTAVQTLTEADYKDKKVAVATFRGKYPASLSGTHMHFLYPAGRGVTNYWLNYQDTAAIGMLFSKGMLFNKRLIGVAGPGIKEPHLTIATLGANVRELARGETRGKNNRLIAGSVLVGRAASDDTDSFLGRYHLQMTALGLGDEREFMGWLSPGINKFSLQKIYLSSLTPKKLFNFTTTTNGSERAMVPMSTYEKVMPHNMLPTQLLRSLLVGDIEMAERLGCLELDEEDLSLCSFVCSGKYEYGVALRENLRRIEKENWDS